MFFNRRLYLLALFVFLNLYAISSTAGGSPILSLFRSCMQTSAQGMSPFRILYSLTKSGQVNARLFSMGLINEHYQQWEKYGSDGYKLLENGKFRYYGPLREAINRGECSGARLVREWDPKSGEKKTWLETLYCSGSVRSVSPKPPSHERNHHVFDEDGNYLGRR